MSTFRRVMASIMALALLAGCASQAAMDDLNSAQQACSVGDTNACQHIPIAQLIVDTQKQESGQLAAALILLPLVILAAAAGGGGGYGNHHGYGHYAHYHH
jgi:outer membrane murein-binding lipoprotein Lpp